MTVRSFRAALRSIHISVSDIAHAALNPAGHIHKSFPDFPFISLREDVIQPFEDIMLPAR